MDLMKSSKNTYIADLSKTFNSLFEEFYNNEVKNYSDFCNQMGKMGNFIRGDRNLSGLFSICLEEKNGNKEKSQKLAKEYILHRNY